MEEFAIQYGKLFQIERWTRSESGCDWCSAFELLLLAQKDGFEPANLQCVITHNLRPIEIMKYLADKVRIGIGVLPLNYSGIGAGGRIRTVDHPRDKR
jgi:hypothetical protein